MRQLFTSAAFALAVLVSACKSTAGDQGAAVGTNVTKAAEQIDLGIQQIDTTVAALKTMVESPAPDLKTQFKTFSKSLDGLESTAGNVREIATEMEARGQEYFTQWNQQIAAIQNEDIRERSADRRKAVEASFSEVRENYGEAKEAFQPLMSDLKDIRTALESDLTLSGLKSLEKTVGKVNKGASSVTKELKDLSEDFRELGLQLSRQGPPPAPTAAPK